MISEEKKINLENSITNKTNKPKNENSCKKFFRIIISHFGFLILVFVFIVGGGFLFQLLERHASIQKCEEGEGIDKKIIKNLANKIFNYVWLNSSNYELNIELNSSNIYELDKFLAKKIKFEQDYDKDIAEMLGEFRKRILLNYENYKYYGQRNCIEDTSWIIESSFLFTMSLITTIGYGHITPITWEGMVVCICFSMIGIPLCLICITKLSGDLADLFRLIYSALFKFFFGNCLKKTQKPKIEKKENDLELYALSLEPDQFLNNLVEKNDEELENNDMENRNEDVPVPLAVTFLIIACYIMIGSFIFKSLEGWSTVQSSYFSFITIATIGLGDLIPGIKNLGNNEGKINWSLIVATIYLFFGISIMAMCFDLMQETFLIHASYLKQRAIKSKIKNLGKNSKKSNSRSIVTNKDKYFKVDFKFRKNSIHPK